MVLEGHGDWTNGSFGANWRNCLVIAQNLACLLPSQLVRIHAGSSIALRTTTPFVILIVVMAKL